MDNESPARGRAPRLRGGRPRGEAQGHRALTEQEWVAHYGETVLPASEVNLRTPDGQALALLITARLIATGRLGWLRAQQILKAIALARDATHCPGMVDGESGGGGGDASGAGGVGVAQAARAARASHPAAPGRRGRVVRCRRFFDVTGGYSRTSTDC